MYTVKEDTTLVGISELRTNISKVLEAIGKGKVLLEKRNKPLAVILSIEKYNFMEKLVELIEDIALGQLAKARDLKSIPSDYLNIDEFEKRLRPRK